MSRNIEVVAVRNEAPNVRLYVLALIALARQLQAEEAEGKRPAAAEPEGRTDA